MAYQRILTIQDISCVGQCSLTVALPVLSACGIETCVLPSAVLSTHTGGFSGYTFRDLTEDIPAIQKHWQKEGILFDAVYTGYLGSEKQIDSVADIFRTMTAPGGKIIVDPAMGDHGKLYAGFDAAYAAAMKRLCLCADVIVPNITEACSMTGLPYCEAYDEQYIRALLDALTADGMRNIVLTGVSFCPEETGVVVYENRQYSYYKHPRIPRAFHGTGDIYASAFTGAWVRGFSLQDAARIAADYVMECIRHTLGDEAHWYGVKFEPALPQLIAALQQPHN